MGDISQRGLDMIKAYESYSSKAYLCPEQVPTIGWGSIRWSANKPVKMGDKCTVEQAEDLLRREVILIEDAIDSSVKVPLTQGQFDCLCSWGYNVGTGWINGKRKGGAATLIKYLNKGQYDKVPGELVKFKKGAKSGKSYNGLLARRQRELRELWFSDHGAEPLTKAPAVVPPVEDTAEPVPQSVAPAVPTATEVIKDSGSAQVSIFGIIVMAVQQAWSWTFDVANEAGVAAVGNQQALSPFSGMFKAIGSNMETILAAVVVGTLVTVILRRIAREQA